MRELHVALIGGPQYDRLREMLPAFERQHGYRVTVEVQLPHVELNARMADDLGTPRGRYDLISTHTKYAPSQAAHLRPLDTLVAPDEVPDFFPRVLHRLHTVDRVTPPDLLERWYYDEVSTQFRAGHVLMIGDWPGFYGLYTDPQTCAVIAQYDIAVYPPGPAGVRKSYAGCHSFAIPKAARDVEGALALLRYLVSPEVQYFEASASGHTPVRRSVFDRVKRELPRGGRDARRMAALEETIERYAMVPPKFARYPMVEDILWVGVQQAITGAQTPQAALGAMERQGEEALGVSVGVGVFAFPSPSPERSAEGIPRVRGMHVVGACG